MAQHYSGAQNKIWVGCTSDLICRLTHTVARVAPQLSSYSYEALLDKVQQANLAFTLKSSAYVESSIDQSMQQLLQMNPAPTNAPPTRRCITYGTFDLFHDGHRQYLQKAKEFGSYLIVAVVTDGFNAARGKYNIRQSTMERVAAVQESGLANEIILAEYDAKINDILKHKIDVCLVEPEWAGPPEYREHMRQYCELIVVERTANISSTQLRGNIKIGITELGTNVPNIVRDIGGISGTTLSAILRERQNLSTLDRSCQSEGISTDSFETFIQAVDAVYIGSDRGSVCMGVAEALSNGKHVMYEPPLASCLDEAENLRNLASKNNLVLLEASPIAYLPALERLIAVAQNGKIGRICSISVNYSGKRETAASTLVLARVPLLPVVKLLGLGHIASVEQKHVIDMHTSEPALTRIDVSYSGALATVQVGRGVVLHEDLVLAGTKGYVYVPAPWWRMTSFEVRLIEPNFEDFNTKQTFNVPTRGGGYRYDIAEFVRTINANVVDSHRFSVQNARTVDQCIKQLEAEE